MKTVEILPTERAAAIRTGRLGCDPALRHSEKELSAATRDHQHRMELSGVIAALSALKEPCHVLLTTDSKYVVDSGHQRLVYGWQKRAGEVRQKTGTECRPVETAAALLEKHRSPSTGSKDTPDIRKTNAVTSWRSCSVTGTHKSL